ncbi:MULTISPECIES: hypothetical protein [unclassified Rhodococcus (in: high G+C Gram-positive bacteria)]|uniref:hypothetical protein n=1 Tax=unclassified Rhodococcus (in: high G+C Gram-positive bacteria) TaxID=192944 RepID=UPI0024BAF482|nr:hypothetical protein [Rhodococcus sp. H29-C3]MDJ0363319.1 hypothetical protein [Rhodococcus sp. H29-C3]
MTRDAPQRAHIGFGVQSAWQGAQIGPVGNTARTRRVTPHSVHGLCGRVRDVHVEQIGRPRVWPLMHGLVSPQTLHVAVGGIRHLLQIH